MSGGAAFPSPGGTSSGMDLRDYFAAHAPITVADAEKAVRGVTAVPPTGGELMEMLSGMRYVYADAMLKARKS